MFHHQHAAVPAAGCSADRCERQDAITPRIRSGDLGLHRLAVLALVVLLTQHTRGQTLPASGLYQIVSGKFTECCGIVGPYVYSLPDQDETFVKLSVDSALGTASMKILGEDKVTVFHTPEWIPGSGFTFGFSNGIVHGDYIQFGDPIAPPAPGIASYSYIVSNSVNTLTIHGRVSTPIVGADVPNQFRHTNIVATLLEARPTIDRVERNADSFQFHLNGEPPYDYTIENSDSLTTTNWIPIATYRAKLLAIDVVITNSFSNAAARFFRVRKDPCNCR